MPTRAPLRVGVTGGIGSGKSTVIGAFARLGAVVIDTDAISHALTAPGGGALAAIAAQFGAALQGADGGLDRAAMRALVFADASARQHLEAILHPRILADSLERARQAPPGTPLIVFDVPLLVEAHAVRAGLQLDRVLVVDCPPQRQLAHALARGGLRADEIAAIMAAQAPRAARLDLADDIIVNAGTREALDENVAALWSRYVRTPAPAHDAGGGGAV